MEEELNPELSGRQPQPKEMIHYLELLKDHGVDFEASDLEHLWQMDTDELTEYFYQALLEAGIDDPEAFMTEHALVEGFHELTQTEFEARKSMELRGEEYLVDQIDERDRRDQNQ